MLSTGDHCHAALITGRSARGSKHASETSFHKLLVHHISGFCICRCSMPALLKMMMVILSLLGAVCWALLPWVKLFWKLSKRRIR